MSVDTENVDLVDEAVAENIARTVVFAALIGAFAFVSFPYPLSPSPVTLQVLGVFLAGIMLGPVWAGTALVLYLLAGALGAPVFSGGSAGLTTLFGPTGGYLFAFPLAAVAVGFVIHGGPDLNDYRDVGVSRLVAGMAVGTVIIYALGAAGLYYVYTTTPNLPNWTVGKAIVSGALVFLPAEALKMAAAVGIVRSEIVAAE